MSEIDFSKYSNQQLDAARIMANPDERYTIKELAERIGVSERTIYRWKEDKEFIKLVNELCERHMDNFLGEVYRQLRRSVLNGNTRAIELAMKRAGVLIDKTVVKGEVEHTVALDGKTNEQLLREIAELEKKNRIDVTNIIDMETEKLTDGEER